MHVELKGNVKKGIIKTLLDEAIKSYGVEELQAKYLSNIVFANPINKEDILDGLFAEEQIIEGAEIVGIHLNYNTYRVRYKGIDVTVILGREMKNNIFIFDIGVSTKGFKHYKYSHVVLPKYSNELKAYLSPIHA